MSRAALGVAALFFAVACGGTTELGSERDSTVSSAGGGAAGQTASGGAGIGGSSGMGGASGSDSGSSGTGGASFPGHLGGTPGFSPTPECRGKHCGHFCNLGGGGGPGTIDGFCDRQGACVSDFPACDADRCAVPEDCMYGVQATLRGDCLQCSDDAIACGQVGCDDGYCSVAAAACPTGVHQCNVDAECLFAPAIPCEACPFSAPVCPRTHCIDHQCIIQYPRCEEYSPCRNKHCGALCEMCAPDDPSCVEGDEPKSCNPFGECVTGVPRCN